MGKHNPVTDEYSHYSILFFKVLSGTALSFLVSFRILSTVNSLICTIIITFFVLSILIFKTDILQRITAKVTVLHQTLALFFSAITLYRIVLNINLILPIWRIKNKIETVTDPALTSWILVLIVMLAFWAVTGLTGYFISRLFEASRSFIRSLNKTERYFLITSSVLFTLLVIFSISSSMAFTQPIYEGKALIYDVIYISDSPNLLATDVFFNIGAKENDLRQPLFAVTSIPFSNLAWIGSKLLFNVKTAYALLLQIIQICVLSVTAILVSRLNKLKSLDQTLFLGMTAVSFPIILFSVVIEQYIFSVFWLILFIQAVINDQKDQVGLFILATGNILTTGFLFPLLTKATSLKVWLRDLSQDFLALMAALVVFGQFHLIYFIAAPLEKMQSIVPLYRTFEDKLLQYLTFVSSCFIAPPSTIDLTTFDHPSFQQVLITKPDLLGILLIGLAFYGYWLHRTDLFAKISMAWVILSYLILGLIGWGTIENGLILYVLYFGWAYASLITMGMIKTLRNFPKTKITLWSAVITVLLINNLKSLDALIRFGIRFYPWR